MEFPVGYGSASQLPAFNVREVHAKVDHRPPHEKTAEELWQDVRLLIEMGWYQSAENQADNAVKRGTPTQEQLQLYVSCARGNINAAEQKILSYTLTLGSTTNEQTKSEARAWIEFHAGHARTDVVRPLCKALKAGYTGAFDEIIACAGRVIASAEVTLGETKKDNETSRATKIAQEIRTAITNGTKS